MVTGQGPLLSSRLSDISSTVIRMMVLAGVTGSRKNKGSCKKEES